MVLEWSRRLEAIGLWRGRAFMIEHPMGGAGVHASGEQLVGYVEVVFYLQK